MFEQRKKFIEQAKFGPVPIWFLVVPGIPYEQEADLEDIYWFKICLASPQEIKEKLGVSIWE